MPPINFHVNTETAVKEAKELLKTRLGMVTQESANTAISHAVNEVKTKAETAAKALQNDFEQQIAAKQTCIDTITLERNAAMSKVEELLGKNKSLEKQNQDAMSLVDRWIAKIKARLEYKAIQTNPDGSTVQVNTNLEGFRGKRVLDADGQLQSWNVESQKGTFHFKNYKNINGKARPTVYVHTQPNGEVYKYTLDEATGKYGKELSSGPKIKAPKPTIISKNRIKTPDGFINNHYTFMEIKMSDGTTRIEQLGSNGQPVVVDIFPKGVNPSKINGFRYELVNGGVHILYEPDRTMTEKIVNGVTQRTQNLKNGTKIVENYSVIEDAHGNKIHTNRTTFTKEKQKELGVKRYEKKRLETLDGRIHGYNDIEVLVMNNGDRYEYNIINEELHKFNKQGIEVPSDKDTNAICVMLDRVERTV